MKKVVSVIVGLVVFLGCFAAYAEEAQAGKVNINTATSQELSLLPRVGDGMAKRIIEFRTQHGNFVKPEDLMLVKGIGKKAFETLKPYLAVSGPTTLKAGVQAHRSSHSRSRRHK